MRRTRSTTRRDAADTAALAAALDERGHARLPGLLDASACERLIALYAERERFRSFIDMRRHRFGEGDYRYFAHPLPPIVQQLRERLYAALAPIANAWEERLETGRSFPPRLESFLAVCRRSRQKRPTPLLLHYEAGGYNCLHQDLYGPVYFPLQVACLLSRPGRDFEGGEVLLVEQRPRSQSRGEAIVLERGEGLVFPCRERPIEGARGAYRARVRHGVSTLRSGERFTLGIIFHDAE
ncbi:MAG: hypothetical protein FJ144_00210 [Deltaproteobacteria bacterium]|nr:hypothetical protein [Deltaproteobacteria bacterium]